MRRHNLDVIVAIIIVIFNMGWSLASIHQSMIGVLLALPQLFVIPGYLLTDVLFQKRLPGIVHRAMLSLTMSLCVVVFSGFLLNLLPEGLTTHSWSIYLGGLNILLGLLTILQRRNVTSSRTPTRNIRLNLFGFILLGLALVLIIVSLCYSAMSVTNQLHPGFTQLWLLPSKEINHTWQLRLGVLSNELAPTNYTVTVHVNHRLFRSWPSITLDTGQEWDQFVSLSITDSNNTYVQVQLDRIDNENTVYREVHITLSAQK